MKLLLFCAIAAASLAISICAWAETPSAEDAPRSSTARNILASEPDPVLNGIRERIRRLESRLAQPELSESIARVIQAELRSENLRAGMRTQLPLVGSVRELREVYSHFEPGSDARLELEASTLKNFRFLKEVDQEIDQVKQRLEEAKSGSRIPRKESRRRSEDAQVLSERLKELEKERRRFAKAFADGMRTVNERILTEGLNPVNKRLFQARLKDGTTESANAPARGEVRSLTASSADLQRAASRAGVLSDLESRILASRAQLSESDAELGRLRAKLEKGGTGDLSSRIHRQLQISADLEAKLIEDLARYNGEHLHLGKTGASVYLLEKAKKTTLLDRFLKKAGLTALAVGIFDGVWRLQGSQEPSASPILEATH